MNIDDWQMFTNPTFKLHFRYPLTTPQGHTIERSEEQNETITRVHIVSQESQEVYFEVMQYPDLAPQEEYQRHRAVLEKRFASETFSISPLHASSLDGIAAQQYSFKWNQTARVVTLIQQERVTYRFIHDPNSAINWQILESVTFTD